MPSTRRVLVATDFSAEAEKALEWARYLADRLPAKIVLLHVIDVFTLAEVGCRMTGDDPTRHFARTISALHD